MRVTVEEGKCSTVRRGAKPYQPERGRYPLYRRIQQSLRDRCRVRFSCAVRTRSELPIQHIS